MMPPPSSGQRPNFFIPGAAKSWTTSLWYYLDQHPEIFLSHWKEPHFFCDLYKAVRSEAEYWNLFRDASEFTVRGEASTGYLSCPTAASMFRSACPEARFVIILRHPADRAYSLYHHMRKRGHEPAATFERALELETRRISDPDFPKKATHYARNFFYYQSGLYDTQIASFLKEFPRDRFLFLTLGSLKSKPLETCRSIFDFLGVKTTFQPNLEPKNVGATTARFPGFHHLLIQRIPRLLQRQHPSVVIPALSARWVDFLSMPVPPLDPITRDRLCRNYAPSIESTARLTGLALDPGTRW